MIPKFAGSRSSPPRRRPGSIPAMDTGLRRYGELEGASDLILRTFGSGHLVYGSSSGPVGAARHQACSAASEARAGAGGQSLNLPNKTSSSVGMYPTAD